MIPNTTTHHRPKNDRRNVKRPPRDDYEIRGTYTTSSSKRKRIPGNASRNDRPCLIQEPALALPYKTEAITTTIPNTSQIMVVPRRSK